MAASSFKQTIKPSNSMSAELFKINSVPLYFLSQLPNGSGDLLYTNRSIFSFFERWPAMG